MSRLKNFVFIGLFCSMAVLAGSGCPARKGADSALTKLDKEYKAKADRYSQWNLEPVEIANAETQTAAATSDKLKDDKKAEDSTAQKGDNTEIKDENMANEDEEYENALKALDSKKTYAVFHTSMGNIITELFPAQAPATVENFIGLAKGTKEWTDPKTHEKTNRPLYDGTIFHRVIKEFMIQGGDPLGKGTGGPGYRFKDEFSKDLKHDRPGRLSMANSGPGTNGSQFFITHVPTPHLDNRHTIFGQTVFGQSVVDAIGVVPKGPNDKPVKDVVLEKMEIIQPEGASK